MHFFFADATMEEKTLKEHDDATWDDIFADFGNVERKVSGNEVKAKRRARTHGLRRVTGIEDFLEAQRHSALTDAEDATKQLEGLLRTTRGKTTMQWGFVRKIFRGVKRIARRVANGAKKFGKKLWKKIRRGAIKLYNKFKSYAKHAGRWWKRLRNFTNKVVSGVKNVGNFLRNFGKKLWKKSKGWYNILWRRVSKAAKGILSHAKKLGPGAWRRMKGTLSGIWRIVKKYGRNAWRTHLNTIKSFIISRVGNGPLKMILNKLMQTGQLKRIVGRLVAGGGEPPQYPQEDPTTSTVPPDYYQTGTTPPPGQYNYYKYQ